MGKLEKPDAVPSLDDDNIQYHPEVKTKRDEVMKGYLSFLEFRLVIYWLNYIATVNFC